MRAYLEGKCLILYCWFTAVGVPICRSGIRQPGSSNCESRDFVRRQVCKQSVWSSVPFGVCSPAPGYAAGLIGSLLELEKDIVVRTVTPGSHERPYHDPDLTV